ncbi:hypothetical protein ACO34A_03485 [Rhizobium sp. ACO-34A]|nr:hypothetical protein [Rhizobium sp. ACO-34A]ATN32863.1 hypothetical protein ACO34A_03485 [Rhizobium sp. ACO-34A]
MITDVIERLHARIEKQDKILTQLQARNAEFERAAVSGPVAYMHPTGSIWRLDNYPAGMDFSKDGWIPLYAAPQPAAIKVKALERQALAEAIAERLRQIEAEGWSAEHDDSHANGEMARAAAAYCLGQQELTGAVQDGKRFLPWRKLIWPWSKEWWKPKTRREDLIRAAALIIAEIERLDRSALEGGGA